MTCGEKSAIIEKDRKSKRIAPLYSKGAYQYMGNDEQALRAAKTAGVKNVQIDFEVGTSGRSITEPVSKSVTKFKGIKLVNGERQYVS